MKKLKEMIPYKNGIVSHMDYDFQIIDKSVLDMQLICNFGEKPVAPIVDVVIADETTEEKLTELASMILATYRTKWDSLLSVYLLEYDPIHNYNDTLTETIQDEGKGTDTLKTNIANTITSKTVNTSKREDNLAESNTIDSTRTDDLKQVDNITNTDTVTTSRDTYGFNSTSSVHADSENNTNKTTGTDTITNTGTQTKKDSYSKNNTGTQTNNQSSDVNTTDTKDSTSTNTKENMNKRVREFSHTGNIGNITSQKMIKEEIELRQWLFNDAVLNDIKDFLTIPIYI